MAVYFSRAGTHHALAGCGKTLILGGAALQHCVKRSIFSGGFSRCGNDREFFRSLLVRPPTQGPSRIACCWV